MAFVFDPPDRPSLEVAGHDARIPVRRIFCVGRNYAAHVREMGNDERDPPFFFTKPADAVVEGGATIPYPPLTEDLHHEVEMVVVIGRSGAEIDEADVRGHLWGAGVGIDLTRRDLQATAKKMGRPWDWAKAFDNSAPIGAIVPLADVPSIDTGRIWLSVNGEVRQDADVSDMIWPIDAHVAILSRAVRLEAGDVVMTGTPAGVGPLIPGDEVRAGIAGLPELSVKIGPPV